MSLMQKSPTGGALTATPPQHLRLSGILRSLLDTEAERICIGDVVDAFGPRAFGALLFVFALLSLVAAVPGSSAVMAIPLLLIAPQLIIGAPNLWLPRALDKRSLKRADLQKLLDKVLPTVERIEKLLAPRLHLMFGMVGNKVIGLACLVLALVLALPIPFFNLAPGMAIAALGLGLAARDGLVVLIGYGIAAGCAVVLVLSAGAVIAAIERILHLIGV